MVGQAVPCRAGCQAKGFGFIFLLVWHKTSSHVVWLWFTLYVIPCVVLLPSLPLSLLFPFEERCAGLELSDKGRGRAPSHLGCHTNSESSFSPRRPQSSPVAHVPGRRAGAVVCCPPRRWSWAPGSGTDRSRSGALCVCEMGRWVGRGWELGLEGSLLATEAFGLR